MVSSWLLPLIASVSLLSFVLTGCTGWFGDHWEPMGEHTCPKYCEVTCWVYDQDECQEYCGSQYTCENQFCDREDEASKLKYVYGNRTFFCKKHIHCMQQIL
eukprot:gnl/TRDRNA2_/TRDRNA2_31534_c0_seq1.p1 gnl/TRDRNA2_/TRDRNA2_31534_c0~~gnl/TRDRNA2_/TRDRNA2_31534_c0_seq1.p1  ORF type:complete len:102 (+),score=5.77 gnl/TRDRNA2_/TRDRNA2_31534_c0_seq1:115-420(+)